jgi:hypothetical protein
LELHDFGITGPGEYIAQGKCNKENVTINFDPLSSFKKVFKYFDFFE